MYGTWEFCHLGVAMSAVVHLFLHMRRQIQICRFTDTKTEGGTACGTFPRCHSAQISGLFILSSSDDGQLVVTASVDQRVTLWSYSRDKMVLRNQAVTHVPQVQSMAAWKDTSDTVMICVVGVGAEMFKFKLGKTHCQL